MPDRNPARRRHPLLLAAAALAVLTLLGACGSGAETADGGGAEPASVPTAGDQDRQDRGTSRDEQEKRATTGSTGTATQGTKSGGTSDRQLLTYTATLRVRVGDPAARSGKADDIVERAGGYVQKQEQSGENASAPYARTTYRVPSAKYETVLDQLGKLGERTSLTQETDNVTQEVADVDARIDSANASLTRLRALLKEASDVEDLITIESEINRREADLESLQARQRALDKQVEYATITLNLSSTPEATTDEDETGFLAGLRAGWHGFVAFLTGVATVVGALLPFMIVLAPLTVAGYLVWRRLRRRPATPTT